MKEFFPNSNCDHDFGPEIPDCKLVQDNVALNICARLYQNLSINKGTKVMIKFF